MPTRPEDFDHSITRAIHDAFVATQASLRNDEALRDSKAQRIDKCRAGIVSGSSVEIICALTGAPTWVEKDVVQWIGNRAMTGPASLVGAGTTQFMCLGLDRSGPLQYGSTVVFWNPAADANLNTGQIDRRVQVEREPVGFNTDGWRRFRLRNPADLDDFAQIIPDGGAVVLESCFNLNDPARFVRPVRNNGFWFLERSEWVDPEMHTFYLRSTAAPPIVNGRRQLTSSTPIRLIDPFGRRIWVNPDVMDTLGRRLTLSPDAPNGTMMDQWRLFCVGQLPNSPLFYGNEVRIRVVDPVIEGFVKCFGGHCGVQADGRGDDGWWRFQIHHPDGRGGPICEGDPMVLAATFDGDAVRYLSLHDQSGCTWIERKAPNPGYNGQIFIADPVPLRDATYWNAEVRELDAAVSRIATNQASLRTIAQQQTENRKQTSMLFDANRRMATDDPKPLPRLTNPTTLTIEARVFLLDPYSDWTCLLSKGIWEARDYHVWITDRGKVAFLLHTTDGVMQAIETPDGAIARGSWQHLACVVDLDGRIGQIYVDGQERHTMALSRQRVIAGKTMTTRLPGLLVDTGAPLEFGRSAGNENARWRLHGYLDEVRIWNSARSARDIRDGMYGYAYGNEPELCAAWRFGEVVGGKVFDLTGAGNDAVIGK